MAEEPGLQEDEFSNSARQSISIKHELKDGGEETSSVLCEVEENEG